MVVCFDVSSFAQSFFCGMNSLLKKCLFTIFFKFLKIKDFVDKLVACVYKLHPFRKDIKRGYIFLLTVLFFAVKFRKTVFERFRQSGGWAVMVSDKLVLCAAREGSVRGSGSN